MLYTTPLSETAEPPFEDILPPVPAAELVMASTAVVDKVANIGFTVMVVEAQAELPQIALS